jgi:hypothetical protein
MSDDAYITLRTVDNWVNGRGLVWNTAERVQTYTHPLWMLLLSAALLHRQPRILGAAHLFPAQRTPHLDGQFVH